MKLCHNLLLLFFSAMLKHSLNNATAICVTGKLVALSSERFHDKANVLLGDKLDNLLHHMVPVLVTHDLDNIGLKLADKLGLLLNKDMLKGLDSSVLAR